MRAIVLLDNIPAVEMLEPVVSKLKELKGWEVDVYNLKQRSLVYSKLANSPSNVVIMTREETIPAESKALDICREKGIPTVLIPHGIIIQDMTQVWGATGKLWRAKSLWRLFKQGLMKIKRNPLSIISLVHTGLYRAKNDFKVKGVLSGYDRFSFIAAYGNTMRDILLTRNVNPDNIKVTGNPKFDSYHLSTDNNGDKVLLLTNYFVEFGLWSSKQREKYVLGIWSVVNAISSSPLSIKIHPVNENIRDYEKIASKYGINMKLYQHEPLLDIISECNIAITTSSSAGMEAMVAGKPLIVHNPYNNVTAYTESSGAYITHNETELFKALSEIIKDGMSYEKDKLAKQFVYEQAYIQDGKATDRIVELIIQTAESSRSK